MDRWERFADVAVEDGTAIRLFQSSPIPSPVATFGITEIPSSFRWYTVPFGKDVVVAVCRVTLVDESGIAAGGATLARPGSNSRS